MHEEPERVDGDGKRGLAGQLGRFLIVGLTAVATDTGVYFALVAADVPTGVAKGSSFVAGTIVAYVLNKFYTFGARGNSWAEAGRFAVTNATTLAINVGVNAAVLRLLGREPPATIVAFVCATGTSTVLNFVAQRYFVFRPRVT